jgi:nicotinate-nucleotide pyrophosphorylase (carboxylating)
MGLDVVEILNKADKLIDLALAEDIGPGDITTDNLVDARAPGHGEIIAKQDLVIAGLDIARRVFQRLDDGVDFNALVQEGAWVPSGSRVVTVSGRFAALLSAERTALNFLQRLSGIATQVRQYVSLLEGRPVKLLDTRKTTPGWRELEKYAVRIGGGTNHRMGLYDAVLIKDNHIAAAGGVARAVARIKDKVSATVTIEVETTTLEEVRQALDAGAHIIMLDNMDLDRIKAAVDLVRGRAQLEVSGGVTRDGLTALAATGVDLISSGALTHSACAVDLSMKIAAQ